MAGIEFCGMMRREKLPPVLFRADGDVQIGLGHLMRCLALARAWRLRGGQATLLSRGKNQRLKRRFTAAGIRCMSLADGSLLSQDLSKTLHALRQVARETGRTPWLVLDSYRYGPQYQRRIRSAGYRLLLIDDFAREHRYHADILLNQNIHGEGLSYPCDPDTVLLLGTRYVLLRSEFLPRSFPRRLTPLLARKILVTLGGSDSDNITGKVLKALGSCDMPGLDIRVLVGAGNPHLAALQAASQSLRHGVGILCDPPDICGLMAWADLAITAGGITCWETAFMGLPSLVGYVADNQRRTVAGLQAAGAAVSIGDWKRASIRRIARTVALMASDPRLRRRISGLGRELVDGEGSHRVLAVVDALSRGALTGKNFRIRIMESRDARSVWRISNDPSVRKRSFRKNPIPWKGHENWFKRRMRSSCEAFYVIEIGDALAGQIRYGLVNKDTVEVHFSVAAPFRGKGLGAQALLATGTLACKRLGAKRIRGIVIMPNSASERAFLNAGYRLTKVEHRRGHACAVFETGRGDRHR